jgi:hypothetical protein
MSRDGFTGLDSGICELTFGAAGAMVLAKPLRTRDQASDSHKTYYGIFLLSRIGQDY